MTDPVKPVDPKAVPKVDPTATVRTDPNEANLMAAALAKVPLVTLNWIRAEYAKGADSKFADAEAIINYLEKELGMQRHLIVAAVKTVEAEVINAIEIADAEAAAKTENK